MNVEELSMIGPNVDLETVNAINKKILLTFVNHFIVNTTLFLNKLSKSCEDGLMSLEYKIQKLETSIVLLESKLNSVPGLEVDDVTVTGRTTVETVDAKSNENMAGDESLQLATELDLKFEKEKKNEANSLDGGGTEMYDSGDESKKPQLDEHLMKYVKMLQFGVPQEAVKLKLEQENVDVSLHNLILNYKK